jgi:hypothetical protein
MKRPRQPLRHMPLVISPSQESSLQWFYTANYNGALTFEKFLPVR